MPVDGGFTDQELTARFRVLPWSETRDTDGDPAEQLRRIWIGWEGVVDPEGNAVPFSNAARDQLIDLLYVRVAVLEAYSKAITGAKQGN
ncbi:MAG: hypothetical protein Q4G49_03055 [Paracoccus sp. (in: a-proteobacteria)]|nr:hypothetical protein [Paracoccus sp. (in: a-proteobacteria)]